MGQRKSADVAAVAARGALVAERVLARRSVRSIAAELARGVACGACASCEEEDTKGCVARVPVANCSVATIGWDMVALRQEWAKVRREAVEQLIGEEVARPNALDAAYWSKAISGSVEAADRVLAIQRERVRLLRLLRLAPNGGGLLPEMPGGRPARVQVTVEYVEDWRAARSLGDGGGEIVEAEVRELAPSTRAVASHSVASHSMRAR